MKKASLIIAAALTTGLISNVAQAQESVLERFMSHVIDQAVTVATNEIELGVQQSVANTVHLFDINGETVVGKVDITDIAAVETKDESAAKGE